MQTLGPRVARVTQLLSALRYPDYRSFWLGSLASVSGFQILMVGQGWLVYQLTGSPLFLGYVGLVTAVPAIVLSLFGGVFADKLDQRRLVMFTESTAAGLMLVLASITAFDIVQVWHVLAIAFFTGAVQAFDQPARQSLFVHLIDRKDLMNAVALNSAIWQGTRIVAPAIGGILVAQIGTAAAFYGSFLGFATLAMVVPRLSLPPVRRAREGNIAQDMWEGVRFIRGNGIFPFLIGMTFFNSFFGLAYVQLMPIFAEDVLEVGAAGLGFLLSVGGVGALLGTFTAAALGNFQRRGWLLIGGATLFGGFVVLFGFSTWYPLSLTALFMAGVFNQLYMISVQTTLQMLVPDELRGRVMGIYSVTWNLIPLGAMQAGAIASAVSASFAVALGGVAVSTFALGVASANSRIRRLAPVSSRGI